MEVSENVRTSTSLRGGEADAAIRILCNVDIRKALRQENGLHPKGTSARYALGRHTSDIGHWFAMT